MDINWESFINFSGDITIPTDFFKESAESSGLENTELPNGFIEEPIKPLIELEPFTDN